MNKYIFICGIFVLPVITMSFSEATKSEKTENSAAVKTMSATTTKDTLSASQKKSEIPPIIISPSSAGEVAFPHKQHFNDMEIECKACHHEFNASKVKFPHDNYFDEFCVDCKSCHKEIDAVKLKAQACTNCHHADPTDIGDATLSSKAVIHNNCWSCHETGTGKEASANCQFCHTGPKTKL